MSIEIALPRLHPGQRQVVEGAARYNVLNCGRRWGKNVLLHDRIVHALLARCIPVGWGSPTYKNLADDWRNLANLLAPVTRSKSEQDRRIETVTGGVLEMWSLDNPDNIRGRSYGMFVVNEGAYVPYLADTWNKIITPTLVDRSGGGWLASTPNGMNDWHTLYTWGSSVAGWKSWTFTSYDNPHIDPAELDRLKLTMTEREFQQEVMAAFIQSEGAVFRNLDAATTAVVQPPEEHREHTIVGGADWGKSNDYTALSLGCVECKREVYLDRFNQIDYAFQVQRLEALAERWKVKRWRVELNSIGQPIFEQLQRRGLPVVAFQTTAVSKTPLIEGFSLALEKGDLQLLPDAAGLAELRAYEVKRTPTGNSTYSAPDGMHDDTVIARALMWQQMRETPAADPQRARQRQQVSQAREVFQW